MKQEIKVKNIFGEKLDVLIEGNENAKEIIVFIHGLGTNKDEGFNLHRDITESLQNEFLICRFDQSSFGKSEGRQEDANLQKSISDLRSILFYIKTNFSDKKINIIAHSAGTRVVSILSPENIQKTIFTGVSNMDLISSAQRLEKRIISRGGKINKDGVTLYKRINGEIQKIGRDYWRILENVNLEKYLEEFSQKTDLIVFKSLQDEAVGIGKEFENYKKIKTLRYIELDGDHNFTKLEDRKNLILRIQKFLEEKKSYVFIDGQNLYCGTRDENIVLDYEKLFKYLKYKHKARKVFLFLGYLKKMEYLYGELKKYGYELIFKEVSQDNFGKTKGNVDIDLILKIMLEQNNFNQVILITSDGDFAPVVRYLKTVNKFNYVISPSRKQCSYLLKKEAESNIKFIEDFQNKVNKKKKHSAAI